MAAKKKAAQKKPTKVASISRTEAIGLIQSSNGKFLSVKFTKKSGEERTLTGRTGVTAGVKGVPSAAVGPMGYIRLYTNENGNWRLVDTRTISEVTLSKRTFKVRG